MNQNMNKKKQIVIVGLGKTGFSCVRYFVEHGYDKDSIAVIDSRDNPPYLGQLKQKYPEITLSLGSLASPLLDTADEIVVSPGITVSEPVFAAGLERGVSMIGDVELLVRVAKAPIVAITGSNGKSTVTTLVGEMAKLAGIKVKVGGNLGTPVLDLLDDSAELYVLELSSFQLETTHSLRAAAATVLNVTADHLDRYGSFVDYYAAKWRIYDDCRIAVINRDDPESYEGAQLPLSAEKIISFGLQPPDSNNSFGYREGYLYHGKERLLAANELKIKGACQVSNALAALALGYAVDLPLAAMLSALQQFHGLPHRCQLVLEINGVIWYNDSKGTNIGATQAAIEGLGADVTGNRSNGKLILIAGGLGKNADFSVLRLPVARYVKTLIVIGHDASLIEQALTGCCKIQQASSMHDAVVMAASEALVGDVVLFSPACASYDMFNDFEHRGEVFMEEVRSLSLVVV